MNAKKISTLILAGAGIAMLAACSTAKTVSRTDAITLLGDMDKVVTASGYKLPTQYKAVLTTKTTADNSVGTQTLKYVSDAEMYFSSIVKGTVSETSNSSTTSYTADGTVTAQVKDGTFSASYNATTNGTSVKYYVTGKTSDTLPTAAIAAIKANLAAQTAVITTSPAHMKQYISAFATGTGSSAVKAGATIGATTYMTSESYTSKGTGNLDMKITPHYTKGSYQYDEAMEYTYDSSRVTMIKNDLKSTTTNYTWDSSAIVAFSTSGLTDASSDLVGSAVVYGSLTAALGETL
jgi:hypothetical protein